VSGKLERDSGIVLKCVDPAAPAEPLEADAETVPTLKIFFKRKRTV
jgi:hypothetical protein